MKIRESKARIIFRTINYILLSLVCIMVVLPIWNVIVTSLAEDREVMGNAYLLWPRTVTFRNYTKVFRSGYMRGFFNSLTVAAAGTAISVLLTIPMGYVLSRKQLLFRRQIMKLITLTMVFDAGLMPLFVLVRWLGLIDSSWSMIWPFAISTFNLLIVKNFMTTIPESLIESARLDGCNDLMVLVRIVIPLSVPILAAVMLFYFVSYWNRYMEAVMFINSSQKYPLQVMLRTIIFQGDSAVGEGSTVYNNTKMAVMMLGMLPVLAVYPFVQRYFISGLLLGGVKE